MTATPREGGQLVHEAALYGSEDELLDLVVPFLRDGVAAGEPTLLGLDAETERFVCDALGDTSGMTVLRGDEQYERPLDTLLLNHQMFTDYAEAGAQQIRIVGQVPPLAASWDGWVRYEAAINHFYATLPIWGICPYDTRNTPEDVIADVKRTHPYLWTAAEGHQKNPRYIDPAAFLGERARGDADPLEQQPPDLEVTDPSPGDSRATVADLARTTPLDDKAVDGLVLAVNETVTNATVHGQPPITLRAWAADDRIVVTVHDRGNGPTDPYAGLLPTGSDANGGRGLWLARQLCSRVTLTPEADGFTVRLVAGTPAERSAAPAQGLL